MTASRSVSFAHGGNTYRKLLPVCLIVLLLAACAPAAPTTVILTDTPPPAPTAKPTQTTAPTPTSKPTETLVPTATPSAAERAADVDVFLVNQAGKDLFTGSVLIAQQGKVLLSKGYGFADRKEKIPNTPTTRFYIASITKQFTAMAILILQAQDKLSIDDLVCDLIPDCPAAWEAVTIHQLLTHTSGIPNLSTEEYDRLWNVQISPEELIAIFKDLPLDFQPGEKWSYSNSGYSLLGYIIEQVSGQTYADFLQQYIFTPLNMNDTAMIGKKLDNTALGYQELIYNIPVEYYDPTVDLACGDLASTVEDLYKWEQALSTEKLVPQAALDEMFSPQIPVPEDVGWGSYGYGWFVYTSHDRPIHMHPGWTYGYKSIIARYPAQQVTIIVLSNSELFDFQTFYFDVIEKTFFGD